MKELNGIKLDKMPMGGALIHGDMRFITDKKEKMNTEEEVNKAGDGWLQYTKQFKALEEFWNAIPEPTNCWLRQQIDIYAGKYPNKETLQADVPDKYKIDLENEKITGFKTYAEYEAHEAGYNECQGLMMEAIEKWGGSTNSALGAALSKKFSEMFTVTSAKINRETKQGEFLIEVGDKEEEIKKVSNEQMFSLIEESLLAEYSREEIVDMLSTAQFNMSGNRVRLTYNNGAMDEYTIEWKPYAKHVNG